MVDNILTTSNASTHQNVSTNATSSIVKSLESQIARTLENDGHFRTIQPNIAVDAVTINHTEISSGIGFATIINDIDEGFTASNVKRFMNEERPANVSASIELPSEIFRGIQNQSGKKLARLTQTKMLTLYNNMSAAQSVNL